MLALLGLSPSQGQQLCNIAAALSTRTFMGEDGPAADDADYSSGPGKITSSMASSGPANAAALAASWAAGSSSSSTPSYNSISRRWPGLSRSSSSGISTAAAAAAAGSNGAAAALAVIGVPDAGFNAALFQEVDPAGRQFAVSVQASLLQLVAHVAAAAPAAAAAGSQQEQQRRFSAAVTRLFQPVSVSRSQAAHHGRKGAALLAHYPAMPMQHSSASEAAGSRAAGGLRPPLSPGRQQQLSSRGSNAAPSGTGGGSGFRSAAANSLGFPRSGSSRGLAMRSSMSVVSMLSFSSLKNEGSMDGGSDAGGAAAAAIAAAAQATTRSWSAFMGLLPGVTPLLCLWALSSSSQGSLLQVRGWAVRYVVRGVLCCVVLCTLMGFLPGVTPLLCLWPLSSSSQGSLLQVWERMETAGGSAPIHAFGDAVLFCILTFMQLFAACLLDEQATGNQVAHTSLQQA